jgi:diaminohydroxyphosphoribosylaminopyrimidine deaminase/5-amino-6-(5-phosphoribosylamino)uracil reductase
MTDDDRRFMQRALELARRGEGWVEPNPMVGCVLVRDGQVVGEGWHQRFGGPHAEVEALRAAGAGARGATAYVTLEPCCTTGKTPPCTEALIHAGVARVVAACADPNPAVNGRGLATLAEAGIVVETGVLEAEAAELIAPFRKLQTAGRPWVIAKWAMTLDGKLATRTGDSKWISSEASRDVVHALRGRVDAIVVGRGTVEADDPLLTARPSGPRVATRVVLDSRASLSLESQLVRTASKAPVLVAAGHGASAAACDALRMRGVGVWQSGASSRRDQVGELLDELGRRQLTNVLVEGGGEVLGEFFDASFVDEVHVFVAPKIVGGSAPSPFTGIGAARISDAVQMKIGRPESVGPDVYLRGRVQRTHND